MTFLPFNLWLLSNFLLGQRKHSSSNASETLLLLFSTRHNIPHKLTSSSKTYNSNLRFFLIFLILIAVKPLQNLFVSLHLFSLYWSFVRPCMECSSRIWNGSTRTVLLENVKSRGFPSYQTLSFSLTLEIVIWIIKKERKRTKN